MASFSKIYPVLLLLTAQLLASCSTLTASLGKGMGQKLSDAVLNSDDPETVRQGLPAYLLTADALLQDSQSSELFRSAATLNSTYASQFAVNPEQKQRLTEKAWRYAQRAACLEQADWCEVAQISHDELKALLAESDSRHLPLLYNLGSVWASWIETHTDDWNALGKLGHVHLLMERVLVLDESYEQGVAHLYLGVLSTLIPQALGGKPEVGKKHFERAWELSSGHNLMVKVLYAERYGRLVFDRELHDRLLQEVLSASVNQPGFILANTLAQQKARNLLDSADQYF